MEPNQGTAPTVQDYTVSDSRSSAIDSSDSGTDTTPPVVETFQVSPHQLTKGYVVTISYTVSDIGGSGLYLVNLLYRWDGESYWRPLAQIPQNGTNGPVSYSLMDSPCCPGKCWYWIDVCDNAGNWNEEKDISTNTLPGECGPIEVEVT